MFSFHFSNPPPSPVDVDVNDMDDVRPHTADVHRQVNDFWTSEDQAQFDVDMTPRASASAPTVRASKRQLSRDRTAASHQRRLSRDDTALDLHTRSLPQLLPNLYSNTSRLTTSDVQTSIFGSPTTRIQTRQSVARPTDVVYEQPSVTVDTVTRSKTKRFRLIEKITTAKSRRASSSCYAADSSVRSSGDAVPPNVVHPPSPPKRAARQGEYPRKHLQRNPLEGSRKDTPAPALAISKPLATSSNMPVRPVTASNFGDSKFGEISPRDVPTEIRGGDSARKAAALHNNVQFHIPVWSPHPEDDIAIEDIPSRPRLGSRGSFADSAADLTNYSCPDMPFHDEDGDVIMATEESAQPPHTPHYQDILREKLPDELAIAIFKNLDAADLVRAESVNRAWHTLVQDPSVWRTAFLRRYQRQIMSDPPPIQIGGVGVGRPNRPDQQWRRMYKARVNLDKNWRAGADVAGKAVYLSGHTDSVYCLQFDEEKIITGSRDRTIRVWDVNNYQCLRVIGGPNHRPTLGPKVLRTVDYPSFHMATASVNGTAYGDSIYHTPREWHDASILCLQYDEKILVTGSSDSDLLVWDIKTYEPIKRLKRHTGGVLDVALDAKHIVSCSKDSRIIVWDRETLQPRGELHGHRGPVNAVQLRGHLLVSASGDGIARLWDLNQMRLVKEFSAKERGLAAVEFSEDMKYVLAGGNDNITYKFDRETGEEVRQFTGHTQLVRSLWLDSANKRVVSGSYDLDLRVYDFETGNEIWRGEEWTTSWMLAAKSDYRRIVATSQDGRILVVDFGIHKSTPDHYSIDGETMDGMSLLRSMDHTTAIEFTDPFAPKKSARDSPLQG